jgi:adenylate cyclase
MDAGAYCMRQSARGMVARRRVFDSAKDRGYLSRKGGAVKILNQKSLDEKLGQAAAVIPGKTVSEIRDFILSADDALLYHINPYRFAAQRKVDRTLALRAFLHLTKGGLFNLYWNIHCPACKGITQHSDSLLHLKHADTCPVCSTVFEAGFDRSIEVSFGVNPSIIKPADVEEFDKIVAVFDVEPGISMDLEKGESHFLKMDLREGNYFAFVGGEQKALNLVVQSGKAAAAQKITFAYREDLPFLTIVVANEGPAEIVILNKGRGRKGITFARMGPARWPSAAVVSSLQDFRDLFSSEMLSLNETFSIENLGFLFTDLKGSTEMYERLGDAQAFALVKEHFYIMERLVREHSGGVVKTIGDAVMAVFTDPRDALRTAVEMIEAFDDLETAKKLKNAIIVKVGIHHGPCIAVTLNERIDYFGTTVNIAARVQGLSDGRDVMASGKIFTESNAAEFLREKGWAQEAFTTSLKGLKASYLVHKLHAPRA